MSRQCICVEPNFIHSFILVDSTSQDPGGNGAIPSPPGKPSPGQSDGDGTFTGPIEELRGYVYYDIRAHNAGQTLFDTITQEILANYFAKHNPKAGDFFNALDPKNPQIPLDLLILPIWLKWRSGRST
eukprot:scaffold5460_cov156-Cylindrotheca_fusiformis.AAC.2